MSELQPGPHRLLSPDGLPPPRGYAHAVVAAPGRVVALAGQIGADASGRVVSDDLVEQFAAACDNVVTALAAAGARPEHVVSLQLYVTDVASYRARRAEIGEAYRARFGKHYPAMALFGVTELADPPALIELVATAVIPER